MDLLLSILLRPNDKRTGDIVFISCSIDLLSKSGGTYEFLLTVVEFACADGMMITSLILT